MPHGHARPPDRDEDNAIALIRFESGAIGQFEVSWTFRGGMDLRDEVAGTHGTIWLNHFLRTGFEMFTAGGGSAATSRRRPRPPRAGCSRSATRRPSWATSTCSATCSGRSRPVTQPRETFYDGYVVNAVMDACYRSAKSGAWEPVELEWRGGATPRIASTPETFEGQTVIKREILPDGRHKLILKDEASGRLHGPGRGGLAAPRGRAGRSAPSDRDSSRPRVDPLPVAEFVRSVGIGST